MIPNHVDKIEKYDRPAEYERCPDPMINGKGILEVINGEEEREEFAKSHDQRADERRHFRGEDVYALNEETGGDKGIDRKINEQVRSNQDASKGRHEGYLQR